MARSDQDTLSHAWVEQRYSHSAWDNREPQRDTEQESSRSHTLYDSLTAMPARLPEFRPCIHTVLDLTPTSCPLPFTFAHTHNPDAQGQGLLEQVSVGRKPFISHQPQLPNLQKANRTPELGCCPMTGLLLDASTRCCLA